MDRQPAGRNGGRANAAVVATALAAGFVVLAWLAVAAHRAGDRCLAFLAPLVDPLVDAGRRLSILGAERQFEAALVAVGVALAWAAWLWLGRARGVGALALAVGIALAGEALIVGDHLAAGSALFVAGFALALAGGLGSSSAAVLGTPDGRPPRVGRVDLAWLGGLTLLTMVVSMYGVNYHPQYFFHEQISHFIEAMSLRGVRQYMIEGGFYGNAPGAVHVVLMWMASKVLGAGLLTVRLISVFGAVVTVPVFYLFVHRYFGRIAAICATLLMILSPTHIWFGRTDDNFFIFVPLLAIGLAWTTLRAIELGGVVRWLPVAGLMVLSRFVYAAGQLAWMLPAGVVAWALLRRPMIDYGGSEDAPAGPGPAPVRPLSRPWAGSVAVAVGLLLWALSVTLVLGALRGELQWISPFATHGAGAWDASQANAGFWGKMTTTVAVMGENMVRLAMGLFWKTSYGELFWYRWSFRADGSVWLVSAAAALLVPALGLLCARLRDLRAAVLLIWMAVAIVPGCLSSGLGIRRVLMLVPPVYVAIGVCLSWLVRGSTRRWPRRLAAAWTAVVVTGIALVGANGGLRAPSQLPDMIRHARFVEPLFVRDDLMVHDLDSRHVSSLAFFNYPLFVDPQRLIAVQEEPREDWPYAPLRPEFRGNAEVYRFIGRADEARRQASLLRPRSVAIVLRMVADNQGTIRFLEALFPDRPPSTCCTDIPDSGLWTLEVPIDELDDAARPEGRWRDATSGLWQAALPGVAVRPREIPDAVVPEIRGGLRIDTFGWYSFEWRPECGTRLTVDGRQVVASGPLPLVAGVHRIAIQLAGVDGCAAGLELRWSRFPDPLIEPVEESVLWGPDVAAVGARRLERIEPFEGHGSREPVVRGVGGVWDMAAGAGELAVLTLDGGAWSVLRFDAPGEERSSSEIPVGPQPHGMRIAMSPQGVIAAVGVDDLLVADRAGSWQPVAADIGRGAFTDLVYEASGHLWLCHFDRRVLLRLTPDLATVATYDLEPIGGNSGVRPIGLEAPPNGGVAVLYEDGLIQFLGFSSDGALVLQKSLKLGIAQRQRFVRLAIPASGWVHATLRPAAGWLTYDAEGVRRIAETPERSLLGTVVAQASVITAAGDAVYVCDDTAGTIWRVDP